MSNDTSDEQRMREATRSTAYAAHTSMWLIAAEFTAASRYETDPDMEEKVDAFVAGAAWGAEHLPPPDDREILRILEKEHVRCSEEVWRAIRNVIQKRVKARNE